MISLPKKRKSLTHGIAKRREFPRHKRYVRSHECIIAGKHECSGPIVFAHVRSAANSGTGLKPVDCFGVSLCDSAHKEQHQIGQKAFERKYGVDLFALAREFARRTPDTKLKEAIGVVA